MVRDVKGFTFVELMISMIILSIVLTIVTGTMVYISKRNAEIDESNHGYQIAKEKLIELQSGALTVGQYGSDEPTRNGIDYDRSWEINTDALPYPVTVKVTWDTDGRTDSVVVVGYVNSGVCAAIDTNAAPTDIILFNSAGDTITSSPISIAKNGGVFVCSLYAVDKDTADGDIVTLDFDPTGADNDKFEINADNEIYSLSTTTTGDKTYNIKVMATDCGDSTYSKSIIVNITNDVDLIVKDDSVEIQENIANSTQIFTMSANPSADTWEILPDNNHSTFAIDNGGNVTIKDNTLLDFEGGVNPITFSVRATKGVKEDTGILTVSLTDINEAPYAVTISPDSVFEDAGNGTFVGTVKGKDYDDGDTTFTYTPLGGELGFDNSTLTYFLSNDSVYVNRYQNLAVGLDTIRVDVEDQNGLNAAVTTVIRVVTPASACDDYNTWNSSTDYSVGPPPDTVTHNGIVWECTEWSQAGTEPDGTAKWKAFSICGSVNATVYENYNSNRKYNWAYKNALVKYNGHLYVNLKPVDSNLGKISDPLYWEDLGAY